MLRGARVSLAAASRLARAAAPAPAASFLSGSSSQHPSRISLVSSASRVAWSPASTFSLHSSKSRLFASSSSSASTATGSGAALKDSPASDAKPTSSSLDVASPAASDAVKTDTAVTGEVSSSGAVATELAATDAAALTTSPNDSPASPEDDDDEWEWVTDDEGVALPPSPPANEQFIHGAVPSHLETFVVKPYKYKRTSPGIFLDHIPSPAGPSDPLFSIATHRNRSFAITLSGRVFSKGLGTVGQLGHGFLPYLSEYTEVHDLPPIRSVFPGKSHTLFLASDGSLHVTGCCSALDWLRPSARLPRAIPTFGAGTRAGKVVEATGNKYWAQVLTEKGRVYSWQTSPILSLARGGAGDEPKKIVWGGKMDAKKKKEKKEGAAEGEEEEEEEDEDGEEEDADEVDDKDKGKGKKGGAAAASGDAKKDDKTKTSAAGAGTGAGATASKPSSAKTGASAGAEAKKGDAAATASTTATDGAGAASAGEGSADSTEIAESADAAEKDIPEEETEDYINDGTGPKAVKLMSGGKVHHGFINEKGRLYLWGLNGSAQLGRTHRTSSKGQKEQVWHSFSPMRCEATELSPVYDAAAFNSPTLAIGEDNNLVKFGVGRSAPVANQYLRGIPTPLRDVTVGEDNTVLVDKEGGLYSLGSYELIEPIGYPGFGEDASARYGRIVHVSKGRHPVLLVECNPAYQRYINAAKDKEARLRKEVKESGVKARFLERAYAPNQEFEDKNKAKEKRPDEED